MTIEEFENQIKNEIRAVGESSRKKIIFVMFISSMLVVFSPSRALTIISILVIFALGVYFLFRSFVRQKEIEAEIESIIQEMKMEELKGEDGKES